MESVVVKIVNLVIHHLSMHCAMEKHIEANQL